MENNKEEELAFEGKTIELFFTRIGVNYVSYLPTGKTVLLDKREKDALKLSEGVPYISFIKKEVKNVAFATIISEAFLPRVIILQDKILVVTKTDEKIEHFEFKTIDETFEFLKEKQLERIFVLIRY